MQAFLRHQLIFLFTIQRKDKSFLSHEHILNDSKFR